MFVPGRNMLAVARRQGEFEADGVAVQVSPPQAIETLAGKADTYSAAAELGVAVPVTRTVTDLAGYRSRRRRDLRLAAGARVCFKPDLDFGGHGFRILDDRADTFAELTEPPSVRISYATAERLFGSVEEFPPLIVSEYLEGAEISIDCLSTPDGRLLAALPRSKAGLRWTRELVDDRAAVAIAQRLVEGLGLRYLSNVQVRYRLRNGRPAEPVLLEVNTRAASGLYQACLAGSVNLPDLALRMVLGETVVTAGAGLRPVGARLQRGDAVPAGRRAAGRDEAAQPSSTQPSGAGGR